MFFAVLVRVETAPHDAPLFLVASPLLGISIIGVPPIDLAASWQALSRNLISAGNFDIKSGSFLP